MRRLFQSFISFLIDNDILDGAIFCFVFGISLSLPFAVIIGLGKLSEAVAIAFGGFVIGGLSTVAGAWLTARPQMDEYRRKGENALDDVVGDIDRLVSAFNACNVLLDSTMEAQFAEVPLSTFQRDVLPSISLDSKPFDALPRNARQFAIKLRKEIEHISNEFSDLLRDLTAWSANRSDGVISSQIVDRSQQVNRALKDARELLTDLRAECKRHGPATTR